MSEIWKPISPFIPYEASSLGRIRNTTTGTIRKFSNGGDGYKIVVFGKKPPMKKNLALYVHRMVAFAFLGVCPPGMEVSHQNGDKTDNRICNLAYETKTENMGKKKLHGTEIFGTRNAACKVTPEVALEISKIPKPIPYGMVPKLVKKYGVSHAQINRIMRGVNWSQIKEETSEN